MVPIAQFWLWSMQSGLKNAYESIKAFSETDLTGDLKKIDMPTLVMHCDDDQVVPVKDSARKSARLIKGARDIYYPGAPHVLTATHQDQINTDLLAFRSFSSAPIPAPWSRRPSQKALPASSMIAGSSSSARACTYCKRITQRRSADRSPPSSARSRGAAPRPRRSTAPLLPASLRNLMGRGATCVTKYSQRACCGLPSVACSLVRLRARSRCLDKRRS
jgi:hypothetical protein